MYRSIGKSSRLFLCYRNPGSQRNRGKCCVKIKESRTFNPDSLSIFSVFSDIFHPFTSDFYYATIAEPEKAKRRLLTGYCNSEKVVRKEQCELRKVRTGSLWCGLKDLNLHNLAVIRT